MSKKKTMKLDPKTLREVAERESTDRLKESKVKEIEGLDSKRSGKIIRKNEGRKGNN